MKITIKEHINGIKVFPYPIKIEFKSLIFIEKNIANEFIFINEYPISKILFLAPSTYNSSFPKKKTIIVMIKQKPVPNINPIDANFSALLYCPAPTSLETNDTILIQNPPEINIPINAFVKLLLNPTALTAIFPPNLPIIIKSKIDINVYIVISATTGSEVLRTSFVIYLFTMRKLPPKN